jgi:hypothetical protein
LPDPSHEGGTLPRDTAPLLPQRGDKVKIPKGAYISTSHPAGDRIAKRGQVVTVSHSFEHGLRGVPEVSWAGSGGYWCNSWEWEAVEP